MLYFLLIIIAIGVLLASENGRDFLDALIANAIFLGLGLLLLGIIYLSFRTIAKMPTFFTSNTEKSFLIVALGITFISLFSHITRISKINGFWYKINSKKRLLIQLASFIIGIILWILGDKSNYNGILVLMGWVLVIFAIYLYCLDRRAFKKLSNKHY